VERRRCRDQGTGDSIVISECYQYPGFDVSVKWPGSYRKSRAAFLNVMAMPQSSGIPTSTQAAATIAQLAPLGGGSSVGRFTVSLT